jgi:hypothetical protein
MFFLAITRDRPEVLKHLLNSHRQTALTLTHVLVWVSIIFSIAVTETDQRCWSDYELADCVHCGECDMHL